MSRRHRSAGLTLVELLLVIVVVGILATILIPRYHETRTRALRATIVSDLRSLAASQEIYHLRNLAYGPTPQQVDADASEGVVLTIGEADEEGWSATGTHDGVAPGRCAYFFGDASPAPPATSPGVVACDF